MTTQIKLSWVFVAVMLDGCTGPAGPTRDNLPSLDTLPDVTVVAARLPQRAFETRFELPHTDLIFTGDLLHRADRNCVGDLSEHQLRACDARFGAQLFDPAQRR